MTSAKFSINKIKMAASRLFLIAVTPFKTHSQSSRNTTVMNYKLVGI